MFAKGAVQVNDGPDCCCLDCRYSGKPGWKVRNLSEGKTSIDCRYLKVPQAMQIFHMYTCWQISNRENVLEFPNVFCTPYKKDLHDLLKSNRSKFTRGLDPLCGDARSAKSFKVLALIFSTDCSPVDWLQSVLKVKSFENLSWCVWVLDKYPALVLHYSGCGCGCCVCPTLLFSAHLINCVQLIN